VILRIRAFPKEEDEYYEDLDDHVCGAPGCVLSFLRACVFPREYTTWTVGYGTIEEVTQVPESQGL